MENLQFDDGIRCYRINGGGALRFNPADPNVYARFLEAEEKLLELERKLTARLQPESGLEAVRLLAEADRQMKQLLSWVFGGENDFETLMKGVNLLAVAGNGQRVVTNLFAALEPVLTEGAERCAAEQTAQAVAQAECRRAQQ